MPRVGLIFELRKAETKPGEIVRLTGSSRALGNWVRQEGNGLDLRTGVAVYPLWTMLAPLWIETPGGQDDEQDAQVGAIVEYKYVKDPGPWAELGQTVAWEDGVPNRRLLVPKEGVWIVSDNQWNQPGSARLRRLPWAEANRRKEMIDGRSHKLPPCHLLPGVPLRDPKTEVGQGFSGAPLQLPKPEVSPRALSSTPRSTPRERMKVNLSPVVTPRSSLTPRNNSRVEVRLTPSATPRDPLCSTRPRHYDIEVGFEALGAVQELPVGEPEPESTGVSSAGVSPQKPEAEDDSDSSDDDSSDDDEDQGAQEDSDDLASFGVTPQRSLETRFERLEADATTLTPRAQAEALDLSKLMAHADATALTPRAQAGLLTPRMLESRLAVVHEERRARSRSAEAGGESSSPQTCDETTDTDPEIERLRAENAELRRIILQLARRNRFDPEVLRSNWKMRRGDHEWDQAEHELTELERILTPRWEQIEVLSPRLSVRRSDKPRSSPRMHTPVPHLPISNMTRLLQRRNSA